MATGSGITHPLFLLREPRGKKLLTMLFCMLVCVLGIHTGVWAFTPGTGLPPGPSDVNHPGTKTEIIKNNSVANGVEENIVRVYVVDAAGNPVVGATVTFKVNGISQSLPTLAGGIREFSFGKSTVGESEVEVYADGNRLKEDHGDGNPIKTNFVAGPPDFTVSFLTVEHTDAKANNTETNIVRAHITDAFGHPLAGEPVTFEIFSGTATPAGGNFVLNTGADGTVDFILTSAVAGVVRVRAKIGVGGNYITDGDYSQVRFVADAPSTSNPLTRIEIGDDGRVANNAAQNTVVAYIVDANGNPVEGAVVKFSITGGTAISGASFVDPDGEITTGPDGKAIIPIKSRRAGTVLVEATVNGTTITNGSPVTATFVADQPDVTKPNTYLAVVIDSAVADNVDRNRVRAIIRDANNNPVGGATVVFTITSGTATFVGSTTVTTLPSGNAYIYLRSAVAGDVYITATVNGVPIIHNSPVKVTFIADVPSTTNPLTRLEKGDDGRVANNTAQNTVIAYLVDANGNPVPNTVIRFSITGGTAIPGASFDDAGDNGIVTTDANGKAILPIKSTKAGTVIVTATVGGTAITNGSPVAVTFVSDVPAVSNPGTKLVIDQNDAIANGTAQNSVTAWVVDANGNPVANAFVIFTLSGGADFYNAPAGMTDADGKITLILTSLVAGWNDINATVDGASITNGAPAKVRFKADAPSTSNPATTITVGDNLRVADNVAKNTVIVHVVDANGNPVEGAEVNFTMEGGTAMAGATFDIAGPVFTNADGDAIMPIRSSAVGTVEIKAKVGTSPVVNGEIPAIVTFVNDVPAVNNPATTLSVEVTGATANGTALNKVKARVVDAYGHPVPGATIDFDKSSGVADFDGPYTGLITDANGEVIVSLKSTVAGFVDVIATVNSTPIVNGSPATVEFVADAPSTGHNATALIVVVPEAIANGTATTSVKAHIADANGNPVKNADVDFSIFSGTGTIEQSNPVKTDENGDAIITIHSTVVGEVEIIANVGGSPITNGSTAKVRFIAGDPAVGHAETALIVVVPEATADGVATTSVKAHVVDANGHIIPGVNVVFTIAAGTATIVETNPVTTNAAGDAIITLHSTVAGEISITATINGVDIINGSPAKVRFKAGAPDPVHTATALIVVVDRAQANGVATNSVKAHVVDTYGNPVEGAEVVFTIANGTATINETNPIMTNADGDAIITLVSTVGGTVDITATVNGVAIVNGSPATVTFTTDPDIAHPDTRLIVMANDAIADGVETNSVKAHLVDATGTPLNLKEVFFKIESGDATVLTVQPVLTDVNGDATILLASKKAGGVTVTAKVGDKPIVNGSPAKLRFVPIDIYVPRVFTPNNDGQNDVAKPIVVGLTTFHYFNVYNRWGNLIFTTKDPNVGWDGRFKGVLQPVETYLWIAEGLDKDKKKITRRGMISLVR